MIGWLIFGGIVLLIVFLLICSVRINIVYENELDYKATYLFFRVYPTSDKAKVRKRKKEKRRMDKQLKRKQAQTKKNNKSTTPAEAGVQDKPAAVQASAEAVASGGNKSAAANASSNVNKDNGKIPPKRAKMDFDYIMKLIDGASPPVKRIIRKIRVNNLYVDYVVGGADAAAVAMKYGAVNAAVGALLGWLAEIVRLHKKEILIEADFAREKSDIFVYCDVKLRLSTALACCIWLLWRLFKVQLAESAPKRRKKRRKSAKPVPKKQGT